MKLDDVLQLIQRCRRPRKGAWIEIRNDFVCPDAGVGRPRKGAWIEMKLIRTVLRKILSPPQGGVD